MNTLRSQHAIHVGRAQDMSAIISNSIELVVTSPPYPMVEMWDKIMNAQNVGVGEALMNGDGNLAFELMHKELDKVWSEVSRVLIPGGIVCVNIGDATRTIDGNFALYSNHSRIINYFVSNGFVNLPNILWRKQTNAPNKFMGSGMLPAGAYVTLEHEWILIFRKGGKREFKSEKEKHQRRASSFFWEERNVWFSDLWDNVKGTKQKLSSSESRERSAAYPLEIPYRLINMYSLQGDTVLDPFVGTGTTSLAALICNRNSVGYDIDSHFAKLSLNNLLAISHNEQNDIISSRIKSHEEFIVERSKTKEVKHYNANIESAVMTSQECTMSFSYLSSVKERQENVIEAEYTNSPIKIMRKESRKLLQSTIEHPELNLF
ncbi:MAG: site-specific DNA-methyltransferase [Rikenellaceae bacterium]